MSWEPDIFDLIDWAEEHQPELLAAIHHVQDQYTPLLEVWKLEHGKGGES